MYMYNPTVELPHDTFILSYKSGSFTRTNTCAGIAPRLQYKTVTCVTSSIALPLRDNPHWRTEA